MKNQKSSPTRDDVAREAGVSSATVSRVYNKPDSVSPEKAREVRQAAVALGYEPNRQASHLRRKGTGTLTLVAFVKKDRPYYWGNQPLLKWMYADIIRSVLEEVSKSMFQLQIQTIEVPGDLRGLKQSDGLIGYNIETPEEARALASLHKPYIICHHTEELSDHPSVGTDNQRGGELQAEWLKRQGVKRPLYITGNLKEVPADRRRMEGFLEAYGKEKVILIDNLSGIEEGRKRADEIEGMIESAGADGVACVNDMTLLGILSGKAHGTSDEGSTKLQKLPLIAYDNLPVLPLVSGRAATMDLRLNLIYRAAVSRLIKDINGSDRLTDAKEKEIISPVLRSPLL